MGAHLFSAGPPGLWVPTKCLGREREGPGHVGGAGLELHGAVGGRTLKSRIPTILAEARKQVQGVSVSSTSQGRPSESSAESPILAASRLRAPQSAWERPQQGRRRRITGHPLRPVLAAASAYTHSASARMVPPTRSAHSAAQDRLRLRLRAWRTPRSRACRRGRPTTARELTPAPLRRSLRPASTMASAGPTLYQATNGHVIRPSWELLLRTAEGAAEGG